MHQSGCRTEFAEHQLRLSLDERTRDHLIGLRQKEDLIEADYEGLGKCTFCGRIGHYPPAYLGLEFCCL